MTPEEATDQLFQVLSKHYSYYYINQPSERYEILVHTVKELLAQGADVDSPNKYYQGTPLLYAISCLHSPEIIRMLQTHSSNPDPSVLTRDYVEGANNECFMITRITNIHNTLLILHHMITNDFSIDIKLVDLYKQRTNYVPYVHPTQLAGFLDKKGTVIKKKRDTVIVNEFMSESEQDDSDETHTSDEREMEEIQKNTPVYLPREIVTQFMEIRLKEYCSFFNLNLDTIISRGEIYPDDFTK